MDYLSGNAGAIVAAMKLYQLTGEIEYCTAAVETEKDLWKKGQRMEVGYGWKLKKSEISAEWTFSWKQWLFDGVCGTL